MGHTAKDKFDTIRFLLLCRSCIFRERVVAPIALLDTPIAEQGPPKARECRSAARHFLACEGHIMESCVIQKITGQQGGSVHRIVKSEIYDVAYLFP